MNRRNFLTALGSLQVAGTLNGVAWAASPASPSAIATPYNNLLVLIELKGANDGLNTVIPFANPRYAELRPRLAIARDQIVQLTEQEGLHPSLQPLLALWQNKELAIVQGLGYPSANLSHFRSIEIWETASKSEEYLEAGWLARVFAQTPAPRQFAADGVVVGSSDMGPLSGPGVRTIALADTAQFLRNAKLAQSGSDERNAALKHILAQDGAGRRVAVFTSGGVIGLIVQSVLHAPDEQMLALNWRVRNCSQSEFTFSRARISLDSFNTLPHLDDPALWTYR